MSRRERLSFKTILFLAIVGLLFASSAALPKGKSFVESTFDLHPYGFPVDPPGSFADVRAGILYLSQDRLALFFDQQPSGISSSKSRAFHLITLTKAGQLLGQTSIPVIPGAVDITVGPGGGLLHGREGRLDFYNDHLELTKSMPLPDSVTGVRFNRDLNQLVISTADGDTHSQTAHFLDGTTLKEFKSLSFPIGYLAIFGKGQLAYSGSGNCLGSAHIQSDQHWISLESLPACDLLAFIGGDALAYAFEEHLHVVDSSGKQLIDIRIPVPDTFHAPSTVGVSDDRKRLAIQALDKHPFAFVRRSWPYYDEILVYDLLSKRLVLKHSLPTGSFAAALSPDGHQLATIERGILHLSSIE